MSEILFVFLLSYPAHILVRLLVFDIKFLLFLLYLDTTLHHSAPGMKDSYTLLVHSAMRHFGSDLHSQLETEWYRYPT